MSKYSWDIKELIERRKNIEKDSKFNQELYDLYTELINDYDIRALNDETYFFDISDDNYDLSYLKSEVFDKIPLEKIKLVTDSIEIAKNYNIAFEEPKYSSLYISDEELIEITRTLFEKIPSKYFLDKFEEFTNSKNHLFHIRHEQKLRTDSLGLTYVDFESHTPYGLAARNNTTIDIITASHEIIHMIVRQFEEPFYIESNKPIYSETEGFFANLLFAELLKQQSYNKDELDNFDANDLRVNLDIVQTTFIANTGFKLMDKNKKINFNKLSTILQKYNIFTPITENNFPFFIDKDESEIDINNVISYLTALDIYELYQTDPEKALYNLLKIPTLEGNNPRRELESINVNFFEDGYTNLNKQCKKLLKRNTTPKLN